MKAVNPIPGVVLATTDGRHLVTLEEHPAGWFAVLRKVRSGKVARYLSFRDDALVRAARHLGSAAGRKAYGEAELLDAVLARTPAVEGLPELTPDYAPF